MLRSFTALVTYSVWFQERGTLQKASPESMCIVDNVVTKSRTPEPPMEVVKPSPDEARRDGKPFFVGPSVIVDNVTVSSVAISPRMSMV